MEERLAVLGFYTLEDAGPEVLINAVNAWASDYWAMPEQVQRRAYRDEAAKALTTAGVSSPMALLDDAKEDARPKGPVPYAATVQEIALWAITNSPILLGDYLDLSDTEIDRLRDSLKQQPVPQQDQARTYMMDQYSSAPPEEVMVFAEQIELLVNTLAANRGLYDSQAASDNIKKLRLAIQEESQQELRRRDRHRVIIRASGIGPRAGWVEMAP
jgi:hypothetical protein